MSGPAQWSDEKKKDHIFHSGTTEGTIVPSEDRADEFIYHFKVWYIQSDGSYKYKTEKNKLMISLIKLIAYIYS